MEPTTYTLQSVLNFRDVGATINSFLGERRIREGLIYRSAGLDDATPEDKDFLLRKIGLRSVIDLRTKQVQTSRTEKLNEASKRSASAPATLSTTPGFVTQHYFHVSITGNAFERFLLWQLSWWGILRVIFLYTLGWRNEAIGVMAHDVMVPRGLVGMGLITLDQSGEGLATALRVFTTKSHLPALSHCTLGKDRTGLVTALLLLALGVPRAAIEHDYALTDAALEPELAGVVAEIAKYGLTPDWGVTAGDMIRRVEEHLVVTHGGVEAYLDGIGFGESDRAALREALLY
ncbi:related to tyrosine/serine protein phosphatase [Cephalotrichum gorgonifer]|uniref:Related to tyrosine/serine protein phosphatase n=1 Tax=Cephalotrichum gorgonifer TaxID=2041049 RepID=A0AAE8MUV3_9PEZI|nr:related to tyrosine/serine protein phosphatase [Cephalotrichum gorgonifer]